MFNPGMFALGVAVGVLGLVLLLSLIIAFAYDERTLLALAAYVSLMVAAVIAGQQFADGTGRVEDLLLVAGPAVLAGLQGWLLKNRHFTTAAKVIIAVVALASLVLLGLFAGLASPSISQIAALVWAVLLLAFHAYLMQQTWDSAGPWKWWLLFGILGGLVVSVSSLAGWTDTRQPYWPVVLMLLLQVPPIYLSLVWRSRLLNESRLRSFSAHVTDPLTGLATTGVLVERLMRVMSRVHTTPGSNALFLIEVQNWQGLLNELGAEFNEKMLLEAAMRLRRTVGDNDLAARIAGGHFAVVAQGLQGAEEVNSMATRLVVSGLRIDSPLLAGVEFKFRVIVSLLKTSKPMTLPETHEWLGRMAESFKRWPGSHRSRSILVVTEDTLARPDGPNGPNDPNGPKGPKGDSIFSFLPPMSR
ncbi:GGDEF domain-containing protein [Polaromonas sp. YR568]|uniref:GGDEF domain-containing protein n=1 Tax=Polaromonas sp. YR568 TaxID=1855301 RepID=UPI0015873335|nr:GGDEF domain-containing protein [Polaromonas sp. YR568]